MYEDIKPDYILIFNGRRSVENIALEVAKKYNINAKNHINNFGEIVDLKDVVFIMDRGYASRELIELLSEKSYYLFRLRTKF